MRNVKTRGRAGAVVYKIPWEKYDPDNPPEMREGRSYFVSDGVRASVGWLMLLGGDKPTWCTPDLSDVCAEDITHFAVITLPEEGGTE